MAWLVVNAGETTRVEGLLWWVLTTLSTPNGLAAEAGDAKEGARTEVSASASADASFASGWDLWNG
ncbi:hypothetical protein GCM10009849_23310 [Sinomonas flava]|uniref:Secreted protein n=1 Tax=Sinomonas flava TaxID=496857 RepID=A0ABN3BW09_9MICC